MKRSRASKSKRGFTIIEVLIVLAIGALILLTVFLAVPTMQRYARDYQRKDYATRTDAALQDFHSYTGKYPSCDTCPGGNGCTAADSARSMDFIKNYLPDGIDPTTGLQFRQDSFVDSPIGVITSSTGSIIFYYDSCQIPGPNYHNHIPDQDQYFIFNNHWCNSGDKYDNSPNAITGDGEHLDNFVILVGLESTPYWCIDNG